MSKIARTGTNSNATNTEILSSVSDNVALEAEINANKQKLSNAITLQAVPSTDSDTLSQMAEKIGQIPQAVVNDVNAFDDMFFPSPDFWNVYLVAKDILSGELPSYLPDYLPSYLENYSAFFIGEYLGYTFLSPLSLDGADGYLTSDGDFYTISNGIVTHTFSNGNIETYEANSITHTWSDSRPNRWVAFFYLNDGYSYTNSGGTVCPIRVVITGNCSLFNVTGENRIQNLWVIGTLSAFNGGTSSLLGGECIIQHYQSHSSGTIVSDNREVQMISLPDLTTLSGGNIAYNFTITDKSAFDNLDAIILPNLTSISGGKVAGTDKESTYGSLQLIVLGNNCVLSSGYIVYSNGYYGFDEILKIKGLYQITGGAAIRMTVHGMNGTTRTISFPDLEDVSGGQVLRADSSYAFNSITLLDVPKLRTLSGNAYILFGSSQYYYNALKTLTFPSLTDVTGNSYIWDYLVNIESAYFPSIEQMTTSRQMRHSTLKYVYLGYSTNDPTKSVILRTNNAGSTLIDIELKDGWRKPLNVSTASTTLTAENIALHILDRLGDNRDGSTITITLGTANLNRINSDPIYSPYVAAAEALNYTIV